MRKATILVVDDDPVALLALDKTLTARGYEVTTAQSGADAIELLSKQHFDLLLTDLVMEDPNGMEVLKEAKNRHPEIMALILTGFADMESAISALRHDADDYLQKPLNPDELSLRVSGALERQEWRRRLKQYESILPICCYCKKIRDDYGKEPGTGEWITVEEYLSRKAGVDITSAICPECYEKITSGMEV